MTSPRAQTLAMQSAVNRIVRGLLRTPLVSRLAVVDAYAVMARDNRNFARFNGIGLDPAGLPVAADLHLTWAAGARAFRLTPR
jgi:hypothetical protein